MNGSTVIKKTLPLIIVLLIIIGVAVTCTVLSRDKDNPVISNPDADYLVANEGEFTYTIKNSEVYNELKTSVGISSLVTMINRDLLSDVLNSDGTSYYSAVTNEEIEAEIEEATFPDGKDDLSLEEIAEAEEDYLDTMFSSYGLTSMDEIKEHHRLILAKEAYARDQLTKEIAEQNADAETDSDKYFTSSDYSTYYTQNYKEEYWALIVPFSTQAQAENALKQLGISIVRESTQTPALFTRWVKDVDGEQVTLSTAEVVKAMIDLYNTTYAFQNENYPTNRLILNEGKQYTINADGNYVFNTVVSEEDEEMNTLHYTYDEIYSYQSSVQNYLKNTAVSYNTASEVTYTQKWYTPTPQSYSSGTIYCFILKIAEIAVPEQADVEDEIYQGLFDAEITTTYIETKMAELREEKNITIFDSQLESSYVTSASSYGVTHKTTKKENNSIVATVDGHEYTADQLFDSMDKIYGISLSVSMLNERRFLYNTNFNKYYDALSTARKERDKWIDIDKYKELTTEVSSEKLNFSSGAYSSYGYDPTSISWEEFMLNIYGASNEQELRLYFLQSDIVTEFKESLGDLSDKDESSELWQFYLEKMTEIMEKQYSVNGVHLLISAYSDPLEAVTGASTMLDPEDWSSYQVELAKELTDQIKRYIDSSTGTITEKLEAVVRAFTTSPRFDAALEQNVESQVVVEDAPYVFEGIEVGKFKSAGLAVRFEDLDDITESSNMVEPFSDALKSIWDANNDTDSLVIYGDYLVTVYGYHVYANLSSSPLPTWTDELDVAYVLPTLEIIKMYIEDSTDENLTDEMIDAIETYYAPIYKETSTDGYYAAILQYRAIKDMNLSFSKTNYTSDSFIRAIDIMIDTYLESNIVYNK